MSLYEIGMIGFGNLYQFTGSSLSLSSALLKHVTCSLLNAHATHVRERANEPANTHSNVCKTNCERQRARKCMRVYGASEQVSYRTDEMSECDDDEDIAQTQLSSHKPKQVRCEWMRILQVDGYKLYRSEH